MKTLLALALLGLVLPVRAGLDEALAAQKRGDFAAAHKEFVALAQRGDDVAMISVGLAYYQGEGVKQDYAQAMEWWLKAFKKGNGDAYSNIGVLFRDGQGVPKNKKMAYCLFLITHVCSMGGESTQLRANSCLRRLAPEMTREELVECFNYTKEYIAAYVESKGKLEGVPEKYRPSKKHPALKDEPWWLEGELAFLQDGQPANKPRNDPAPDPIAAREQRMCYQVKAPAGTRPEDVRLDLALDGIGLCGTGLSLCRAVTNGEDRLYEDDTTINLASPRHIVVSPKGAPAQVFVLTAPRKVESGDWTTWQKPAYVESDPMAIFSLDSGRPSSTRSTKLPEHPFELRFRIERAGVGTQHSESGTF